MKYTIPLELIELEESNYHLAVKGYFEDNAEGLWIIDTGASRTVFDKMLTGRFEVADTGDDLTIQSTGLVQGNLDTLPGILHPFKLEEYRAEALKVALIDLSNVNKLYYHATERKICGLIGSDFLLQNRAVIDYSKLILTLRKK